MKTSKWNLATLPCPLCPAAPSLHPALPLAWPWPWAPKRSEPKPCPALRLSSQKVAKTCFCCFQALKTSKWNLVTLPCPLCPAPAPCLRPACPAPCPSLSPGLGPGPVLPLKSCKNVILRFSALENLKMESCNPALPSVPCPCTLPAPCLPCTLPFP